MSDLKFMEFTGFDLNNLRVDLNPYEDIMKRTQVEQDRMLQSIQESADERNAEQLRRHNELVTAIKEAGEAGATIVIGDNANGIQIQQNSPSAQQTLDNSSGLNFEQVKSVLDEIKGYFDYPQFEEAFGANADNVRTIVESTLDAVNRKEDEGLIKKSLHVIKELAVGAAGSLIASGILALIGTLSI